MFRYSNFQEFYCHINMAPENAATQKESPIERLLALRRVAREAQIGDAFSTIGSLKCPPWARGAYGGQLVAQALLASYETVASGFAIHSIHSQFLAAADVNLPVTYVVDKAYDGRTYVTRVVQAKQRNRLVMSAIASFSRRGNARPHVLSHAVPMPARELPPTDDVTSLQQSAAGQGGPDQPCDCVRSRVHNLQQNQDLASERRLRQWIRARGRIGETPLVTSGEGDEIHNETHSAHEAAVSYMSDNYFIGTAFRVHNASRFSNRPSPHPSILPSRIEKLAGQSGGPKDLEALHRYFEALAHEEIDENKGSHSNECVEMMVTLSHTIIFHNPTGFRADEWLLAEMESPWADQERALVTQKIWSHQGTLIATCMQEGVVRLLQRHGENRL